MSGAYVIEPVDGWHAGDRAYCVRGSRATVPTLEAGKVYKVADVIPFANMVGCGIVLSGVAMPGALRGFWSSRFVKLSGRQTLRQLSP